MGSGYYGGFGITSGAISVGGAIGATSVFVNEGLGAALKKYAKKYLSYQAIQMS